MCVVSMIGDYYKDKWGQPQYWPTYPTTPIIPIYPAPPQSLPNDEIVRRAVELTKKLAEEQKEGEISQTISYKEFDELIKKVHQMALEVKEMKELLLRAKKYDEENEEENCENDEKMDLLKKVAKVFKISLEDVLGK